MAPYHVPDGVVQRGHTSVEHHVEQSTIGACSNERDCKNTCHDHIGATVCCTTHIVKWTCNGIDHCLELTGLETLACSSPNIKQDRSRSATPPIGLHLSPNLQTHDKHKSVTRKCTQPLLLPLLEENTPGLGISTHQQQRELLPVLFALTTRMQSMLNRAGRQRMPEELGRESTSSF